MIRRRAIEKRFDEELRIRLKAWSILDQEMPAQSINFGKFEFQSSLFKFGHRGAGDIGRQRQTAGLGWDVHR